MTISGIDLKKLSEEELSVLYTQARYGEPFVFFLLDYISIMILFAMVGYGVTRLLTKNGIKNDLERSSKAPLKVYKTGGLIV